MLTVGVAPRLLLAGPAGVGKSSIARELERRIGLRRIETDALPRVDADGNHLLLSTYDFAEFVAPLLPDPPTGVVLDVGGDSVFRTDADNDARAAQIEVLKSGSLLTVVLLEAGKDTVRERYLNCGKPSSAAHFDGNWDSWLRFMHPRWRACADRTVSVDGPLDAQLVDKVAFGGGAVTCRTSAST